MLWNRFWGGFYLIKIDFFSAHILMPKLDIEDFVSYFSDLWSYKCLIEHAFKISAWMWQSSATSNTLWACSVNFLGEITVQRYFVFVSTVGLWTLYIQEHSYMNTFCECILKKIGPTDVHFQYNARKLMSLKTVLPWGILREN